MRDVNNIIEPELEIGNDYESESSYPSMEMNEYDSSNDSDAGSDGSDGSDGSAGSDAEKSDMDDLDRSEDSSDASMPWENTNMESEEPRSQDLDLDFLDWTYYNRHDKRHRHRK